MVTKYYSHTFTTRLTPKKHHTNVIEECYTIRLAISVLCVSISVPFCWHVWGVSNPGILACRGDSMHQPCGDAQNMIICAHVYNE